MGPHLNNDEIEQLLARAPELWNKEPVDKTVQTDALNHLEACESCQMKVRAHREAAERLAQLKSGGVGLRGSNCPPKGVWIELAAGVSTKDSGSYLNHAAQCEHCGPLLREATSDLAEEISLEDEKRIGLLRSASQEWQRDLAQRLSVAAQSSDPVQWSKHIFTLPRLALAGGLAGVLALALWVGLSLSKSPSADHLLIQAYMEKRSVEMRFEGAPYVPMSQERGAEAAQSHMNRPALLRAESEIAQRLQSTPDNVTWLHARGRASLLERDGEGAVATLEQARRLAPNDESIAVDLASAYFQRGESLGRSEDDGHAVDLLGRVLASSPKNEVARFNYAIALERISLYQQAIAEWQTFLELHPSSGWADEARVRLSQLQGKVMQHQSQGHSRMDDPAVIATALQNNDGRDALDWMDARSESYIDIAVREWLPGAFASESDTPASQADWAALTALARILEVRHKDTWLHDLLGADRTVPSVRAAFMLMSDVNHAIQISDNDRAAREAQRAALLFKASSNHAGELYERFQMAYANQLSHRNAECTVAARDLADSPDIPSYAWLVIQANVESAICASTSNEQALEWLKNAAALAKQHHYDTVRSRSEQVLSAIYWATGDLHEAWKTTADGLHEYWVGDLPPLLGYNLLTNLDYIAQDAQEWFLQIAVLRESLPMIADDPDRAMRAFEQTRLGQALLMTGSLSDAEASFRETYQLFQSVPDGSRKDNLITESEIGLAKIDVQRGFAGKAVSRLGAIEEQVKHIPDDDLALDFFQAYGLALLRANKLSAAQQNLSSALRFAEKGLHMVQGERDRLRWSRRNEPTYRAMVELTLQRDPGTALAYWEWYKGASLREHGGPFRFNSRRTPTDPEEFAVKIGPPGGVTLVSFFVLPHGIAVWVSDASATQERWIDVSKDELESLAQRFSEHCSDPESNLEDLRREGAELYERLFWPVEPLIRGRHALVLEPDGPLSQVPFGALVNHDGEYLGDQYAITVSPGLQYVADARSWNGIFPQSRALVVGNPTAPGWPSLPDAEREARDVAAVFARSHLLLRGEATYANIARELPDADVFHFSGHATANLQAAGVVVNGSALFESSKLDQLHLRRTQLVVLSACSSARGSGGLFDDEDSLARQFIAIGVPEVVASRWSVDSGDTAALMHDFYARLLDGGAVADSLRSAAKELRSQGRRAHPFYWAGFTVFGKG